jgi:signal transduction histidine kinase
VSTLLHLSKIAYWLLDPLYLRQRPAKRALSATKRALAVAAVLTFLLSPLAAAPIQQVKRVLILNIFEPLASPGVGLMDQTIVNRLKNSPYHIELYSENLEATLFPDESSQKEIRDWYIHKYRDRKPDVIIAVGPTPLKFMVESHKQAFPGVPIVFCGSTEEMLGQLKLDSDFTGTWGVAQPEKTLLAALQLDPSIRHVVVVGGVGAYDRELEVIAKNGFENYQSKLDFTYLTDLDMPRLLEKLKSLPAKTIVYHTAITQDAAGTHFIDATQSVPMVAGASNAPVFVVDDVDVGRGTVGGYVLSLAAEGRTVAEMAVRILNGEKPENIPIEKSPNVYMFDSRVLERWGIKEDNLPAGSLLLYRQPTLWETYKEYLVAVIALIVAQALLILGLLWQRARRRKVESELAISNERLREAIGALGGLSGRLIETQEEERRRIAREIHDDYNQRLAVLAFDVEELAENVQRVNGDARHRLHKVWNSLCELGADLHALSHRLHSSTLESLGLVAGIRAFCEEFADQQEMQIHFTHENVPQRVPGDIALCLFRVVQESLRNIKKHSGATRAEVRLKGSEGELHLSVSDRGRGFDPSVHSINGGIGIRSMEERLRLLGGRFEVFSHPLEGTKIEASLPLRSPFNARADDAGNTIPSGARTRSIL